MSSEEENVYDPINSIKFQSQSFTTIKTVCSTIFISLLITFFAFSNQFHRSSIIVLKHNHTVENTIHRSLTQKLSSSEKTTISHILFGIAGSAKTWDGRSHYAKLWWKPNITRGFVWLDEEPSANKTWPATLPAYKVNKDTSMFNYSCWYGSRSAIRLTRIVKESFELGLDNVRWFVMGDDDTLFFTENLVTVLEKYDHNQMYYIGDNSESVEQDLIHSYAVAYGGGGFAISYPLAAELVRILDGCIDRYAELYGSDQKIQACLTEIGVPLTKELGFHQLDIRGNPYGILAAHPLAPLVSLHHLDTIQTLFPALSQHDSLKKLISAYKVDPSRTVQHSFCYDLNRNWSVSVSWGYAVELYPSLLTAKKLETTSLTFQTWKTLSDEPFTFNTRTVSQDPCEKPVMFYLDRVDIVDGGKTTLTTYKRFVDDLESECARADYAPALAVRLVNISAIEFDPSLWRKAPRRQCCELTNGTDDGIERMVHLQIRSCNRFESVTPTQ
ncbi:hypothetical protein FEM48_Zijuj11G0093000 [Ziziphus jujuba var. spinosa]|uniref:Uncharacterized protein n=1 Tax=Ziziphus jujuba var. spinosa TaxID=714518 RepID=A0A978UI39_ZIZJJ|nr:uncharacterized protein LOC107430629 [Ziziphus jujuba var. spinosa]KAH7514470.1 hypothetical protein FEM48_Zijuj11G0093000 [Ziziphus jujuba var. spinosa]